MVKKFKFLPAMIALLFCFSSLAFGQELTGAIEGTIKDPQGSVIPGVQVTVTNSGTAGTVGFNRTITTDNSGFFRLLQVPPGTYTVSTAAASGFGASTNNNVEVVLGKTTPLSISLQAGNVVTTVDVSAGDIAIDTTDSKIQTNITSQAIELLPKGVNFTSLLQTAAAVRNEPLSGGFQIDGASGSENTFIIDGQEVSNFRTGTLNSNNNIPFQFIQEVQIKSSGFEAEFGGATGGVISVVTKGGDNKIRGEGGVSFQPSKFQGDPNQFLRLVAATATPVRPVRSEYIQPRKDGGSNFFPSLTIGGPILKDKIWFFGSYAPQFRNTTRTLDYISPEPVGRVRTNQVTYRQKLRNEYAFGRIDIQPTSTIRMTGSYTWNPVIQEGTPDTFGNTTGTVPAITFPGTGLRSGAEFRDLVGGRQNSNNTAGSIVWTPTSSLVLSARGGYSFLNEKLGNYGVPSVVGQTRLLVQTSSLTAAPANFGLAVGQQNFPGFSQLLFDSSRRRTFDGDVSYSLNGFAGRHQFKGGYQFNGINNVVQSTTVDTIGFRFGRTIANVAGRSTTDLPSTAGAIGAGFLQRFGIFGSAGSDNQAFYIQDSWQPVKRLTLNIGLRTEKENSPSFAAGAPGITFNYGDKLAPRFGFAFDLFGDGKTKLFGSYGRFYDRFKYELPRGSFGGNFFRNDYFEIFPGQTIANFNRSTIIGGRPDPIGGTCPIAGGGTGSNPFTRCQLDFRIPSNLPGNTLDLGAVDPDLQAFRQSEYTFGAERDMGRGYLLSGRYTHKQVDVAVEDIGFLTASLGEAYIIGNPGRGLARQQSIAAGAIPQEAVRDYDAAEVRLNKRFAGGAYFDANYTYSRLFGNYGGLASSDEAGRTSPNVNRNFDLPFIGFTAQGQQDNGRLPTDRPHAFKINGAYTYKWSSTNATEFTGFQQIASGTPRTTRFTLYGVAGQILNRRGDLGRTEAFTQSDFGVRHKYRFGNDGRFTMSFDLDILNLFDERNVLGNEDNISTTSINLDSGDLNLTESEFVGVNIFQRTNLSTRINNFIRGSGEFSAVPNTVDPRFGQANNFQTGRSVRFGFRLLF